MKEALKTIEELQKFTNIKSVAVIVEDREELKKFAKQENLTLREPSQHSPHYWVIFEGFIIQTKDLEVKTTVTFE